MSSGAWVDLRASLPGLRGTALHAVAAEREPEVRRALEAAAFRFAVLDGTRVRDEDSFFEEIARSLDLPAHFGRNWDALDECLRDLDGGEADRQALLWRAADRVAAADAQLFVDAVSLFAGVARDLGAGDPPVQLEVFLFGAGDDASGSGRRTGKKRR